MILSLILSFFLLFFSFPPFNCFPFAWISPLPLLRLHASRRKWPSFWIFYAWGLLFYLASIYWLPGTIMSYGVVGYLPAIGAYLCLSAYLALYFGWWGLLNALLREKGVPWYLSLSLPLVSLEFVRAHLFTGFPWLLLGHTQASLLPMVQVASLGGVWAVSFLVAWISGTLLSVWEGPSFKSFLPLLLPALAIVYGLYWMGRFEPGGRLKVAVVQPNVPAQVKWVEETAKGQLHILQDLLKQACPGDNGLVIYPETAFPYQLFQDARETSQFLNAIKGCTSYVLIGTNHQALKKGSLYYYNRAYLLSPQGESLGYYDKLHLVPFGEYVPLGKYFPFLYKLSGYKHGFLAGKEVRLLPLPGAPFGVTICYESIFPALSRKEVKNGATFLVNITNDAWFGRSLAPYQHLCAALFRAVEDDRWLVRCANTGISAFINPTGKVVKSSRIFKKAIMIDEITPHSCTTLYCRLGDWLPIFAIVVMSLMLFI